VEAHELMARLVARNIPTITFSKAKMTAEMIYRYVCEKLQQNATGKASKIAPYRGGYLPVERREIEKKLFSGELLGVSTTAALELGIDVGSLEACIVVGYPGTRASFFQQSGRAGRKEGDSVVFLIGLDTSVNQYILSHPEYIFEQCVEQAVIDPENPYVVTGHLRCAAHEMPLAQTDVPAFGPYAAMVLEVLEENQKVKNIDGNWYHAAAEIPHHEVALRGYADANVVIKDINTGEVVGQVNKFDAEPILHPGAIYMHQGDTYLVTSLDLDQNQALVRREETDYYTQPLGGTDIHHIDQQLKEKPFGRGQAYWGEVTAYFNTAGYERINFYTLDAISEEGVDLPTMVLGTMAFWIVPPEELMLQVRDKGLDAFSGLRGIGYATRMLLPLFITCTTLDFSHTVGGVNSPWNAIFVYERYPHGLGFSQKAYDCLDDLMPAVRENIRTCACAQGCPACVGKPLRQYTTWNVERGEASIPSKQAALMILDGLLGKETVLSGPGSDEVSDTDKGHATRLKQALRRRLERMREPQVFHPITPGPEIKTGYPAIEKGPELDKPDVAKRSERRKGFDRSLHKRIDQKLEPKEPAAKVPPKKMPKRRKGVVRPTDFPGKPQVKPSGAAGPIKAGDRLAARARKRGKKKNK
jgi:DEAD/DEAH box helicase domain-containing protein